MRIPSYRPSYRPLSIALPPLSASARPRPDDDARLPPVAPPTNIAGTACLWKEYLDAAPDSAAVASDATGGAAPGRNVVPADNSADLPTCSEDEWAKNPDGGRPDLRRFDNATGQAVPYVSIDGNGSFEGKYKYWPDCKDFETDIHTTCAELGEPACPYKPRKDSSLLCEWKAKGASNWMVDTTFNGAPVGSSSRSNSANKGAAGDWLRMAFHDSGQFFLDGRHGSGDDASLWYEVNKDTTSPKFRANFEMAAQTFDTRKKVFRPLNRCGAKPEEACRFPCEEICGYKDTSTFAHFNPTTGSVDVSSASDCYGGFSSDEEAAVVEVYAGEEPALKTAERSAPGGGDVLTAPRPRGGGGAASSGSRPASRTTPVARLTTASHGAGDAVAARLASRDSPGRSLLEAGGAGRLGHHAHDKTTTHDKLGGPDPFASWVDNWDPTSSWRPGGSSNLSLVECYGQCTNRCNNTMTREAESDSTFNTTSGSVSCVVSMADSIQYAAASAVEVTNGPKVLKYIKPGRCDAATLDATFGLPSPHTQSVKDMITGIPFFKNCHCGGSEQLTTLSGSHTLGHAHSRKISQECEDLIPGSTERSRNMDVTPFTFDNEYWKALVTAKCPGRPGSWKRIRMDQYPSCTSPYLTDDWAKSQGFENATHMFTSENVFPINQTLQKIYEGSLFYETSPGDLNNDLATCVNVTSSNENTCSSTVCATAGCQTLEDVAGCACDACDHDPLAHCTAKSTCGTFHSDQMLWATRETSERVLLYANDQDAFFKDWVNAHVRMAHVGCESCGPGSHETPNPCQHHDGGHRDRGHSTNARTNERTRRR